MSLKYEPASEPLHISAVALRVSLRRAARCLTSRNPATRSTLSRTSRHFRATGDWTKTGPTRETHPSRRSWAAEARYSSSHGARPVHLIITMVKWIRTSRLSIKNSLWRQGVPLVEKNLLKGLRRKCQISSSFEV